MKYSIAYSLFLGLLFWACSQESKSTLELGAKTYKTYCVACHGADGKLGLNGAKDMEESLLNKEERMTLITNGKGAMTAFKGILSDEEISAVAAYTISKFKKSN